MDLIQNDITIPLRMAPYIISDPINVFVGVCYKLALNNQPDKNPLLIHRLLQNNECQILHFNNLKDLYTSSQDIKDEHELLACIPHNLFIFKSKLVNYHWYVVQELYGADKEDYPLNWEFKNFPHQDLIEECEYLFGLNCNEIISKQERRILETQKRNEEFRKIASKLRKEHPNKNKSQITDKIFKENNNNNLSFETIRKIIR